MNQLATMSDLVLKGIEQAQQDLRRENDDALWQEGILRHVPIVGSIYNWISPIQKVRCQLLMFSPVFNIRMLLVISGSLLYVAFLLAVN
jgi:hypothetical protein